MQVVLLLQLRKFVTQLFGVQIWHQAIHHQGIEEDKLNLAESLPDLLFGEIVSTILASVSYDRKAFLHEFGRFIFPQLIELYPIEKGQKIIAVIQKTEGELNRTLRKYVLESEHFTIKTIKVDESRLEIIYYSPFDMPEIWVGILEALSAHLTCRVTTDLLALADGSHLIVLKLA